MCSLLQTGDEGGAVCIMEELTEQTEEVQTCSIPAFPHVPCFPVVLHAGGRRRLLLGVDQRSSSSQCCDSSSGVYRL